MEDGDVKNKDMKKSKPQIGYRFYKPKKPLVDMIDFFNLVRFDWNEDEEKYNRVGNIKTVKVSECTFTLQRSDDDGVTSGNCYISF